MVHLGERRQNLGQETEYTVKFASKLRIVLWFYVLVKDHCLGARTATLGTNVGDVSTTEGPTRL